MADRGLATTFLSRPETVFRPAEMMAQQGSRPNCARARGARNIQAATSTAVAAARRRRTTQFGNCRMKFIRLPSMAVEDAQDVAAQFLERCCSVLAQGVVASEQSRLLAQLGGEKFLQHGLALKV